MNSVLTAPVNALACFVLNSPNAQRLGAFYEQAFGAELESREWLDEREIAPHEGVRGGAERTVMRLGDSTLELLEFEYPGRRYPENLSPYDTRFQHLGIVVTDMQRGMQRLNSVAGWTAISTQGPQTLPQSAGGVTAFKFRDPDGHPLEFLQFPERQSPRHWRVRTGSIISGIDHSAMSIRDPERSIQFYQSLGLQTSARTLNSGVEQQRLDGVPDPVVDVIALSPSLSTPHVELLHYRIVTRPPVESLAMNDTAAVRLIFSRRARANAPRISGQVVQDPDGHFLEVPDKIVANHRHSRCNRC